jgi:5-methyltetrahydrofolate--homocysteine methyltransferase
MVEIAREFRRHTERPLAIQSNAGLPLARGDRVEYPETPDVMAGRAEALLELGVGVIGGCCGTSPGHVRAIRRVVDRHRPPAPPSA